MFPSRMIVASPAHVNPAHLQLSSFTPLMVTSRSVTVAPAAMDTLTFAPSVPVNTEPFVSSISR